MMKSMSVSKILPRSETTVHPYYRELCGWFPLQPIENKKHYIFAGKVLHDAMKYAIENENVQGFKEEHEQLNKYIKALSTLMGAYEERAYPQFHNAKVKGHEALEFLMKQHGLKQSDLKKEIGPQPLVSAILSGKRKLNVRQIAFLSKRFHCNPAVFMTDVG